MHLDMHHGGMVHSGHASVRQSENHNNALWLTAMTPMASPARPLLIVISLLSIIAGAIAPAALAEWPMDGDSPAHTSVQSTGVNGPAGQWAYRAGAEVIAPPSAAYGDLFFGTTNGTLVALNEVDGQVDWTLRLDAPIRATPLISSQTVFVPVGNVLYAIWNTNRSAKWSYEAVGGLVGSPILESGTVYIGSEDKHVVALDEYTGALLWSLKLDGVVAASPSVSGLTLVIGTDAGTLYGIHRTEGRELWNVSLGSAVSSAASIAKGIAMVGTYGGRLGAVKVEDGKALWTYPAKADPALDPILTTPATDSGLAYFGSDGLYCIEVTTGELIWHYTTRDFVRGGPAITESYVVFGSYDGSLRCLDKATGNVVWQFETTTQLRSAVSIDYDKAYVGGRDGTLYARSILNRLPPTIVGPSELTAEEHESVRFAVTATDPEGNTLSYSWNFGDGNTSRERSPLHDYYTTGNYTATVTVSDGSLSRTHSILVSVQPFQVKVIGGDSAGMSIALVAGAAVAVVVVVVVIAFLLLRRRSAKGKLQVEVDAEDEAERQADVMEALEAAETQAYISQGPEGVEGDQQVGGRGR